MPNQAREDSTRSFLQKLMQAYAAWVEQHLPL